MASGFAQGFFLIWVYIRLFLWDNGGVKNKTKTPSAKTQFEESVEEKSMFFSDPTMDLKISLALLVVSFVVALIIWAISKKKFLAIVIFSVLGNLSFLVNIGSFMFDSYNLKWLQMFSLLIWPIINIYLIIKYFSKK